LRDYEAELNEIITPELWASHTFSKIFNCPGPLALTIIKEYDYFWDVFCRLPGGDRTLRNCGSGSARPFFFAEVVHQNQPQ